MLACGIRVLSSSAQLTAMNTCTEVQVLVRGNRLQRQVRHSTHSLKECEKKIVRMCELARPCES